MGEANIIFYSEYKNYILDHKEQFWLYLYTKIHVMGIYDTKVMQAVFFFPFHLKCNNVNKPKP